MFLEHWPLYLRYCLQRFGDKPYVCIQELEYVVTALLYVTSHI